MGALGGGSIGGVGALGGGAGVGACGRGWRDSMGEGLGWEHGGGAGVGAWGRGWGGSMGEGLGGSMGEGLGCEQVVGLSEMMRSVVFIQFPMLLSNAACTAMPRLRAEEVWRPRTKPRLILGMRFR